MRNFTILLIMVFVAGAAFAQNRDIDPTVHEMRLAEEMERAEVQQPSLDRAPDLGRQPQPGQLQPIMLRDGNMGHAWNIFDNNAGIGTGPVTVDLDDGTLSLIQAVDGDLIWMAAADYADDIWYAVSNEANAGLYTVDPATGDYDLVGTTGLASATGLAYDVTSSIMYLSQYDGANSQLYEVDLTSGDVTLVGMIAPGIIIGIAGDADGNLYGVSISDDALFSIDPNTGAGTNIGGIGLTLNFAQDIAYDRDNDILYGTLYSPTTQGGLYEIDTDTGLATEINLFIAEVAGFAIPFIVAEDDAPAEVANFTVTAGDEGALHADLAWDNPDETVDGQTLTELHAINIYRDGELIHTVDDPVIGGAETYHDDDITEAGNYTYRVVGENDAGEGLPVTMTVYIGEDVPAAPENIELVADGNDGALTWDAPTSGLFDGYFTGDNITYTVVRFPDMEEVATDITEEHFTDTEVPGIGNYFYTVTASNHIGEGGTGESNVELLAAEGILLFEIFDDEGVFPPVGWNYVNGAAGSYWEQSSVSSFTGDFSARSYQGAASSNLADEWLITPMIDMENPNAQMLVFQGYSSQAPDGTRENMRILAVDQLYDNVDDLHANATLLEVVPFEGEWTEHVVDISSLSGDKHLIFNYYITEDDNATFNWIYIDHVLVSDFDSFTLTMEEPVGEGTVVPAVGDHIYLEGSEVTVSATADMGWVFSHWDGNVEDENSATTTIIMNSDETLTAHFDEFEGMDLPYTEKFDGVPAGDLPANWFTDVANWAVWDSNTPAAKRLNCALTGRPQLQAGLRSSPQA